MAFVSSRRWTAVSTSFGWSSEMRAAGLRWWSTLEASWLNLTLSSHGPRLRVARLQKLSLEDAVVREAAEHLGLAVG